MRSHKSIRFAVGFVLIAAARAGAAPVTAMPTSITFPDTGVGGMSMPVTVTYTNNSNAGVTISMVAPTGANPGDFKVDTSDFPTPNTIGPGVMITVKAICAPNTGGVRTANLTATLGNGMGTVDVPM